MSVRVGEMQTVWMKESDDKEFHGSGCAHHKGSEQTLVIDCENMVQQGLRLVRDRHEECYGNFIFVMTYRCPSCGAERDVTEEVLITGVMPKPKRAPQFGRGLIYVQGEWLQRGAQDRFGRIVS